jgi:hypothetical protein
MILTKLMAKFYNVRNFVAVVRGEEAFSDITE